jgi:starch synthase
LKPDDTVEQWEPTTGKGTGFRFSAYSGVALLNCIHEALRAFKDQSAWLKLMQNGMKKDFSWIASAREYVKVYERLSPPKPGPSEKVLEFSRV